MRFINLFQSFFDHVGINLGGGNIRMAQHHLHGTKIGSAVKQVRGETVPQHVRSKAFSQSRLTSVIAQIFSRT